MEWSDQVKMLSVIATVQLLMLMLLLWLDFKMSKTCFNLQILQMSQFEKYLKELFGKAGSFDGSIHEDIFFQQNIVFRVLIFRKLYCLQSKEKKTILTKPSKQKIDSTVYFVY